MIVIEERGDRRLPLRNIHGRASILSHARGIARAAGFIAWTLSVGGAWLCLRPFLRGAQRTRGGARTLALWSRGLCRLLGIRTQGIRVGATDGGEDSDGGFDLGGLHEVLQPKLIVSNHIGYLDVIVLSALSSASRTQAPALFVSKDDLARWPVMGPLGRSVGTLFLDRERPRAVAETAAGMRRAFEDGASVIVFPEGTTTRGDTVNPFHTALFEPALRAGVPVQGVFLTYAPRGGAASGARDSDDLASWTGDASFVPHLYWLFCSGGLEAKVTFGSSDISGDDRRVVAARLRRWMEEQLMQARMNASGAIPRELAAAPRQKGFRKTAARFSPPKSLDRIFR